MRTEINNKHNNNEQDAAAAPPPSNPDPPDGSTNPPGEVQQVTRDESSAMNPETFGGMFAQPVFPYHSNDNLPCSLHFANANAPSSDAMAAMKTIHDELLGNKVGLKFGVHGACDGPIYVIYLDGRSDNDGASFPGIDGLIDLLQLSTPFSPQQMRWFTTMCPIHQDLFYKRKDIQEEDEEEGNGMGDSTLKLDDVMEVLSTKIDTRRLFPAHEIPELIPQNYACMSKGKVLFLQPRFASLHDGNCMDEPFLCPAMVAFEQYKEERQQRQAGGNNNDDSEDDPELYWYQFQHRPEANEGVILEETTVSGPAKEPGDIAWSPALCLFQLEATGEILALAQWDYRD